MTQNKGDNWVRVFHVDPRKHKDGFNIFKVTSVVFPKNAPEAVTNITVWKRYNDFKRLHNSLRVCHKNCNIEEELPKLMPGSKCFTRSDKEDITRERVKCALDLLNFIARHPPLFTCVPFLQFFNDSYQISDIVSETEISNITNNDNSNVPDSTSAICNDNFVEKSNLNANFKKDDNDSLIDLDDSLYYSGSSDDESICLSEGAKSLPDPIMREQDESDVRAHSQMGYNDSDIKKKRNLDEETHSDLAKSLTSLPDHLNGVGGTVTCHSEHPIKDSEMWVCVHGANDFRSRSHSLLPSGLENRRFFATEDYLVEAGYHMGQAQKCEVSGEYESAFDFYKAAMACLLSGISEDDCREKRLAVQGKINQYAQRAENVYALHMSKKKEEEREMLSCTEGLRAYKVVSVIDKVLLVQNIAENKRYVIKVLEKSPCPVDLKKKTIIPYNVPYMVKLVRYFENENSIFLVLEHASGGKLWDYVDRCIHSYRSAVRRIARPTNLVEYKPVEADEVGETVGSQEKSYFEILKDCTTYIAKRVFGYDDNGDGNEESGETVLTPDTEAGEPEEEEDDPNSAETALEDGMDVSSLVKNSQKLLASIKNTLEQSDYVTDSVNKNLRDLETVFGLERDIDKDGGGERDLLEVKSKKRSKSVGRSRLEREGSAEEVTEAKSRTASNSLDRSGQWSRLATMLDTTTPVLSETTIRDWAAEMFVALETLHRWGVTCRDLHPGNVLLDESGHLLLTFQLHWRGVDASISDEAIRGYFAAPETTKIFPVTPAADWWSFGALLFQLFTGQSLSSCYPGGILSHTIMTFPEYLSPEACSLLTELLRYEPTERLGGGINGSDDIKCHPFFSSVDWQALYGNV